MVFMARPLQLVDTAPGSLCSRSYNQDPGFFSQFDDPEQTHHRDAEDAEKGL